MIQRLTVLPCICIALFTAVCPPFVNAGVQEDTAVLEGIKEQASSKEQIMAAIQGLGRSGNTDVVAPLRSILQLDPKEYTYVEKGRENYWRVASAAAIEALGELGPKAAAAVPFLLSQDFFLKNCRNNRDPLRAPTIAAVLRIGPAAVPDVIGLLPRPKVKGQRGLDWHKEGLALLKAMSSDAKMTDAIVSTLVEMSKAGTFSAQCVDALTLLDDDIVARAAPRLDPSVIAPVTQRIKDSRGDAMTMKLGVRGTKCVKYYRLLKQLDGAFKGNKVLLVVEAELNSLVKEGQSAAADYANVKKRTRKLADEALADPKLKEDENWAARFEEIKGHLKNAADAQDKAYGSWVMLAEAAAMLGEKAIPVLVKQLDQSIGLDNKKVSGQVHTTGELHIANLIGTDASRAAARIVAQPPKETFDWKYYYTLSYAVKPDNGTEICGPFLDAVSEDDNCMVNYIAMVLDRMAPASIAPVAAKLGDRKDDWYGRWGAAKTLELMGPKAKAAVPALEMALNDQGEDLDVRIAAARGLGRINGKDPFDYYNRIPDVEEEILRVVEKKNKAWRKVYTDREGADYNPEKSGWPGIAWWTHSMISGQNLEHSRRQMSKCLCAGRGIGSFMDVNTVRAYVMCHSKSTFPCAGNLGKDLEKSMHGYFFAFSDRAGWHRSSLDTFALQHDTERIYTRFNHNIPMNVMTRNYLSLQVLKDVKEYKGRRFRDGSTIAERLDASNKYWRAHLKYWCLNGFWKEHSSSNYDWHTYASYVNLADLAPDPEVRKLAQMYLDLALIEAEQMTISNQRGGTKSRAKRGGLGSSFNPYRGLLYGERGVTSTHAQLGSSDYQAPPVAVLLHKLGPLEPEYEIINRYGKTKHVMNYAYCTSEYIIGAAAFDPNSRECGETGRWTGIIFRDLSAIGMDGYSGEKWFVSDKDVMIGQRSLGHGYPGQQKITFESGFEKVEEDGWVFVDNGEAFAAVKVVVGGYFWAEPIKRTLYPKTELSPYIFQTGTLKAYASFDAFRKAVLKAPLTFKNNVLTYHGPNSAKIEFTCMTREGYEKGKEMRDKRKEELKAAGEGAPAVKQYEEDHTKALQAWIKDRTKTPEEAAALEKNIRNWRKDAVGDHRNARAKAFAASKGIVEYVDQGFKLPKINGKELDLSFDKYIYKSPYMELKTGSEIVTVRYGDRVWEYDFGKTEVGEVKK